MNAMEMHPYFTEIPLRSFEAMAFEGHLSEVLLALIVDPLEAEDVSRAIWDVQEVRIELNEDGRIVEAPIRLEDFLDLGSKMFEQMKITIAQWTMAHGDAEDALRSIAALDRRLAIWCASDVAAGCLGLVPAMYSSPSRAINMAKAWIVGLANTTHVALASSAACRLAEKLEAESEYSANETSQARIAAIASAAYSASSVFYVSEDNSQVVFHAAQARSAQEVSTTGAADNSAYPGDIRLQEVIANACMTFPG